MSSHAFAKVTQTLPTTKPVMRLWQDTVRLVALSKEADGSGRTRMRAAAEAMFDAAINDKNTAAMALIGDRLDGKVQVQPGEDGSVSLSFVVRLPQQAHPDEWAQAINAMRDVTSMPIEQGAQQPASIEALVAESVPIDGRPVQSVTDLEPVAEVSPPLVAPDPLVPGTPPVVSDRTEQ